MNAGTEVFALTDEQIVGVEPDGGPLGGGAEVEVLRDAKDASLRMTNVKTADEKLLGGGDEKSLTPEGVSYRDGVNNRPDGASSSEGNATEVPQWLAERMKDPWHGDEAKELWDDKQRTEKEVAAYREVFATAEDARALKEIYPGGASEARAAAERARELDAIDAAFYRGDSAARAQLARQMMQQDPAAFREMVEAGVRLLGAGGRLGNGAEASASQDAVNMPRSLHSGPQEARSSGRDDRNAGADTENAGMTASATEEVVGAYREFEKAANTELEKSVGGAIARMMEQALPNLRVNSSRVDPGGGVNPPLQERLAGAVREEVEAALKSDGQLGEQVAKILAGRRFDEGARAQVVRLIDARAQQLVPGAVRRVVGSWTQATLSARGKGRNPAEAEREELGETGRREAAPGARKENDRAVSGRNEKTSATRREAGAGGGRRVDYGRISDEEILGL